ncbi:MAG: rhomboid family intramembrane serine protease, partial [Chitinophagales bacterium]
ETRRAIEKNRTRVSILIPLWFVSLLWIIQFFQWTLGVDFGFLGIAPRTFTGLVGIVFAPLIHGSWGHIAGNTIPLLVLGFMLIYFYHLIAYRIIFLIWIFDGVGVWLIGRESYHIGASGIIYGMASFIFFSGLLRRNKQLLAVALAVVFVYGSMVWGMFPYLTDISWEAHLMGFLSGIALAIYYRKEGPADDPVPEWMRESESESEFESENSNQNPNQPQPPFHQTWSGEIPIFRTPHDDVKRD